MRNNWLNIALLIYSHHIIHMSWVYLGGVIPNWPQTHRQDFKHWRLTLSQEGLHVWFWTLDGQILMSGSLYRWRLKPLTSSLATGLITPKWICSCCKNLNMRYIYTVLYCIVSIHLYSASCSAHQSEALPVRETQRGESRYTPRFNGKPSKSQSPPIPLAICLHSINWTYYCLRYWAVF